MRYALIQSSIPLNQYRFKWDLPPAMHLSDLCTYPLCT